MLFFLVYFYFVIIYIMYPTGRLTDLFVQQQAFYSLSGGVKGDAASILSIIDPNAVSYRFHNMLKEYPFVENPPFKVGFYEKNYDGSGYRMMTIDELLTPEFQEALLYSHRATNGWPYMDSGRHSRHISGWLCIKDAELLLFNSLLADVTYDTSKFVARRVFTTNGVFGEETDENGNPLPANRYQWSHRRLKHPFNIPCLYVDEYFVQVVESLKREREKQIRKQIKKELLERSAKMEMKKVHQEVIDALAKVRPAGQKQRSKRKQKKT